jgi:hypothetical protein
MQRFDNHTTPYADILIACRCCFRYRTDDGTTHTVLLHEEIQRNATPFEEGGLPEGEYEFPFSFQYARSEQREFHKGAKCTVSCERRVQ